jgi:hypothetical protein
VSRHRRKWTACIFSEGRNRYLGTFGTAEAAAWAYDEEAKQQWTNPILNFLPDGSLNPNRKPRMGSQCLLPRHGPRRTPSSSAASAAAAASSDEEEEEEEQEEEQQEEEQDEQNEEEESGGGGKQRASSFRGA